jgi:hypothetical protein
MSLLLFAVSALTILPVVLVLGKIIHKIFSLKDALQDLLQLSNEAETLRGEL